MSRISTGLRQLDRVLGRPYGLRIPSVVVIAGDPGTGKTTLLQKAASEIGRHGPVLYATAEEQIDHMEARARRIGASTDGVQMRACADLVALDKELQQISPMVLIIDSMQTMQVWRGVDQLSWVNQVSVGRYAAEASKKRKMAVLMVCHTAPWGRRGRIPRQSAMASMADVLLKLTATPGDTLRRLEVVDHYRIGKPPTMGTFEMRGDGLHDWPQRAA